jgi:uncharacterized lipoprotein YddW (UPF0748 family)
MLKRSMLMLVLALHVAGLYGQEKSELRAVWLTNVDSNVLSSDQNIAEAMDYLASIGVNVVFPVVYNKGYTLYPSRIMDSLFNAPVLPGSPFVGRDFLQRLVIEAHRNGIEVIPWFEFGFSTSYSQNGGHIIAKFPEWALKTSGGSLVVDNGFDWMSAINPEPQQFILSLLTEVLDTYDVEGVQGDDRLPAMPVEGGYDSVTAAIYRAENGNQAPPANNFDAAWMKWRADKMTQYLGRVRDSVKARGSQVILSVSPTPYYWGYRELLQDSKSWAQQGLTDNIIPQLYQYNISDFTYALNTTWNDVGQYAPEAFSSGILAKVGAYVVDTTLLGQMLDASRLKGAKGESLFFYEALRANTNRIGEYLKRQFYQSPAVPPYRDGRRYVWPAQIVNETDPGASVTGSWSAYLMKGFQGSILRTDDTAGYAAIRYAFDVKDAAHYDVFVYKTPNTPWTERAAYTLYGQSDSLSVTVNQADLSQKGWYRLGTLFLPAGRRTVLKLDNAGLEPGRYLVTDAVMIMINRKLSPDVVVEVRPEEPPGGFFAESFRLAGNYPNPFNPETVIRYDLPRTMTIRLAVYDLLGRQVALLVDGEQRGGRHDVVFRASGLPSGVYFCRLSGGGRGETRKMLLLR